MLRLVALEEAAHTVDAAAGLDQLGDIDLDGLNAGFVVALAGEIMTMPGLPKVPSAAAMRVRPDGQIEGLF